MLAPWIRLIAISLTFLVNIATVEAAEQHIVWRVENPFRLFLDPADTSVHRTTYEDLSIVERLSPILATERRLAAAAPRGWAEHVFTKTCWSPRTGRYKCADYKSYINPQSHRVVAALEPFGSAQLTCTWTIGASSAGKRGNRYSSQAPCDKTVVLDVPFPAGITVVVSIGEQRIAATELRVRDVFIAGIGDSYASGDGNPDRPIRFDDLRTLSYTSGRHASLDGYPARSGAWSSIGDAVFAHNGPGWLSTPCHRSLYSHQLRAALQLALEDPHRAVTFASFACWGSEVTNGLFLPVPKSKLVPGLPPLSQLSALAALQCDDRGAALQKWPRAFDQAGRVAELTDLEGLRCPAGRARKIDLLLVTIGGNDIGFSQLVANAILADTGPIRELSGLFGSVKTADQALAAMSGIADRYKAINRAVHTILHIPWEQSNRVVLTGYPPIALQETLAEACPSGRQGMTVNPGFSLNQKRAEESEAVSARLHKTMQGLAKANGWTFVDAHRAAFRRHGLCAGTMGSLASPADDVRLPRLIDDSWRPYPPSQWEPYASRRRWIRTPNDGYLTVNFHVGEIDRAPINLILASSYSGGFHPTAEGQAAIADAVADKARVVLERYARTGER